MNQIGFQRSHIEAYENGVPIINRDELVTYTPSKNSIRGSDIHRTRTVYNHPLEKQVRFTKYNRLFLIPKIRQTCKRMPVYPAQNHIDSIELYSRKRGMRKTKRKKPKKNRRKKGVK